MTGFEPLIGSDHSTNFTPKSTTYLETFPNRVSHFPPLFWRLSAATNPLPSLPKSSPPHTLFQLAEWSASDQPFFYCRSLTSKSKLSSTSSFGGIETTKTFGAKNCVTRLKAFFVASTSTMLMMMPGTGVERIGQTDQTG